MRKIRCWLDLPLKPGNDIQLPESTSTHLFKVLRLRENDACIVFNGDGFDYSCRVTNANRKNGTLRILDQTPVSNESPLAITLIQSVARGEKMDWILQKATELGVARVIPVFSERSEVRLDESKAEKRLSHWKSVITSACEQCGRAAIPAIGLPAALADTLKTLDDQDTDTQRYLLDPFATSNMQMLSLGNNNRAMTLAIGPEGGWSDNDRRLLAAHHFKGLRLGPRVLRTETAGMTAIACLQALFGDLN